MFALRTELYTPADLKGTAGKAAVAIGALVAVGIALLFLVLSGTRNTGVVRAAQPSSPPMPLIQYRGTGAAPAVAAPSSTATPRYTRAEHQHGLVP